MKKVVTIKPPSPEMMQKIKKARSAISSQNPRKVQCPYCRHNTIIVFEDTKGHVQAKCSLCGKETVFDVLSMRRFRFRYYK